jgi:ribosome-binding factor A
MKHRKEHLQELIRNLAAQFFSRNTNGTSLMTVTNVELSEDTKFATIFISTIPESKVNEALHFAKRCRGELRDYMLENIRTNRLPFLSIDIDKGTILTQKMNAAKL